VRRCTLRPALAVLAVSMVGGVRAESGTEPAAQADVREWQLQRLFNPSAADLEADARGRVMIYDGLTDKMVSRALREQFERVESMMFTRTIVTDDQGRARTDSADGQPLREDDGC
jgi:hypothetical protein